MNGELQDKINHQGRLYSQNEAMGLALDSYKAGRFQEAESLCRKVYRVNPGNPDVLHLSALILYHYGSFAPAAYWIKRAIHLNDSSPVYFYNMGIILLDMGNIKEARDCFHKALTMDPRYDKAQKMLDEINARGEK